MSHACPSCGSTKLLFKGRIQSYDSFAGYRLECPPQNSSLFKCLECNLYFRWPKPSKYELDDLYKKANIDAWQYDIERRKDWMLTLDWIKDNNFTEGSILDVACWDGSFLDQITGNWKRYGIEINEAARNRAISRNIDVIAEDVSEVNEISNEFDVITAFDFIEHIENPMQFMSNIARMTTKDGYIVISSGDSEALTAKIMGAKYWYYSIPEHISFINAKWCDFVAKRLNLQVVRMKKYSHSEGNISGVLTQSAHNILYLKPNLYAWLKRLKTSFKKNHMERIFPPQWSTSKDHILVIFRKSI